MSPQATTSGRQVAMNLVELANKHKTGDPAQAINFKRGFKEQSKNDLCRTIVYLMEVIGSNDVANKYLEGENKDLRELLKLNGIDPDAEVKDEEVKEILDKKAGETAVL